MSEPQTAYVVMIGEYPKVVATDLSVAQESTLADETRHSFNSNREFRWDEYGSDEWRLMSRREEKGARWSWTQRCVRSAPFITS